MELFVPSRVLTASLVRFGLLCILAHGEDCVGVLFADRLFVGKVARFEDYADERALVDGLRSWWHDRRVSMREIARSRPVLYLISALKGV